MRITKERPLALASGSPRRREILESLGVPLVVVKAPVDEAERPGEGVDDYLVRVVGDKLASACARPLGETAAVLVADTTVVLDDTMLAKPESIADARRMIAALAGREHDVKTAFAIGGVDGGVLHREIVSTRVVFRAMTDAEIDDYAASGEGLDKAGAYAVQGRAAAFIPRIVGSYSCVVGLPACEVMVAFSRLGLF
jgi:septum formation protein